MKYVIIGWILLNVITFIVYAWDKRKAKKNSWRTPESTLLLLAVVGGSVGALLAMYMLRHKTQHKKFYIGVPVILVAQIFLLFYLWY
ncbi:MAG: DUF1294 domain-containing protein [Bacteroidales bacterium]|nr:DUF1294 domain-containing protein [Bacteroidales bacterium]